MIDTLKTYVYYDKYLHTHTKKLSEKPKAKLSDGTRLTSKPFIIFPSGYQTLNVLNRTLIMCALWARISKFGPEGSGYDSDLNFVIF